MGGAAEGLWVSQDARNMVAGSLHFPADYFIVYGMVADKDSDAVVRLMPDDAEYFFTAASSRRALPANRLAEKFKESKGGNCMAFNSVKDAVSAAVERAGSQALPLIYIGGSAYVVAEAMAALKLGGLLNRSGGH